MATTATKRIDNLPADISRLVGRRSEAATVRRLLAQSRLVTLTGPGGVGKTRLAIHVARQSRGAFPGGVALVSLADLTTPQLLATTVISALSRAGPGSAGMDELCDYIAERELLLVLDNCEHLTAACAELAAGLLRCCPRLRVLATSRERLRIDGEAVYVVPPLAVPDPATPVAADQMLRYDAAALFLDRATALRPDRVLSDDDVEAILTLCRQLDGLPLAIELMAGRTGSMPIKTLADRHEDRFHLLRAGSRSAPARHQTLQATVEYSLELCTEAARLLWARMSVFAGGATLEGVLSVCTDQALVPADAEDALAELVDKSIVTFEGSRYQMLETLRDYGREQLRRSGAEEAVRTAHFDYVQSLASSSGRGPVGEGSRPGLIRLREEHANIRAALEYCLTGKRNVDGLRLAGSLWHFWSGCGLQREGRHWLGDLLAACSEPSLERATGLWVDGCLATLDGQPAAARQRADACVELARALGDPAAAAHATFVRGLAALFAGSMDEAVPELETAVRLETELDEPNPVLGAALLSLGIACCLSLRLERATAVLGQARAIGDANSEYLYLSWSRIWLGLVALLDGRPDDATFLLKEVLRENVSIGDALGMSGAVEFLAWVAMNAGDDRRAARLLGFSESLSEPAVTHLAGSRGMREWHDARVADLRERLGAAVLESEVAQARTMSEDEGIAFALEDAPVRPAAAPDHDQLPLTRREHEVALLLAKGLSNREIASQLVISPRTAEAHVEHILTKLGFTSRAQVVALLAQRAASE